jgi:hypothetical protein
MLVNARGTNKIASQLMRIPLRVLLALCAGVSLWTSAAALPVLTQETRVLVTFDILPVSGDGSGVAPVASDTVEIPPARTVSRTLDLAWPDAASATRVELELAGTAGPDGEHRLAVSARLVLPGGRSVRSSREVIVREGSTQIVDLYSEKSQRLLLALRAERTTRPVVLAGPRAAMQVRLRLEVSRVDGERTVPLESNALDTFLGQGVEYAFRRGDGETLESMRVVLTPLRIEGEIAEIAVEITGTLPGAPARAVVSRSERLIATRGAASGVTMLSGSGPSGYRFTVTPDF